MHRTFHYLVPDYGTDDFWAILKEEINKRRRKKKKKYHTLGYIQQIFQHGMS